MKYSPHNWVVCHPIYCTLNKQGPFFHCSNVKVGPDFFWEFVFPIVNSQGISCLVWEILSGKNQGNPQEIRPKNPARRALSRSLINEVIWHLWIAFYMGNWGEITVLKGVITPLITSDGAHIVHGTVLFVLPAPRVRRQEFPAARSRKIIERSRNLHVWMVLRVTWLLGGPNPCCFWGFMVYTPKYLGFAKKFRGWKKIPKYSPKWWFNGDESHGRN